MLEWGKIHGGILLHEMYISDIKEKLIPGTPMGHSGMEHEAVIMFKLFIQITQQGMAGLLKCQMSRK